MVFCWHCTLRSWHERHGTHPSDHLLPHPRNSTSPHAAALRPDPAWMLPGWESRAPTVDLSCARLCPRSSWGAGVSPCGFQAMHERVLPSISVPTGRRAFSLPQRNPPHTRHSSVCCFWEGTEKKSYLEFCSCLQGLGHQPRGRAAILKFEAKPSNISSASIPSLPCACSVLGGQWLQAVPAHKQCRPEPQAFS